MKQPEPLYKLLDWIDPNKLNYLLIMYLELR